MSIHSLLHSFIHSLTQFNPVQLSSIQFNSTQFSSIQLSSIPFNSVVSIHFFPAQETFPISKLVPIATFYFWNFRPGACRALPGNIYIYQAVTSALQWKPLRPKMQKGHLRRSMMHKWPLFTKSLKWPLCWPLGFRFNLPSRHQHLRGSMGVEGRYLDGGGWHAS